MLVYSPGGRNTEGTLGMDLIKDAVFLKSKKRL